MNLIGYRHIRAGFDFVLLSFQCRNGTIGLTTHLVKSKHRSNYTKERGKGYTSKFFDGSHGSLGGLRAEN